MADEFLKEEDSTQELTEEQLATDIKGLITWFFNGETPPPSGKELTTYWSVPLDIIHQWKSRSIIASNINMDLQSKPTISLAWSQKKEEVKDYRNTLDKLRDLMGARQRLFYVYPERRYIGLEVMPSIPTDKRGNHIKWVYSLTFEGEKSPVFRVQEELFDGIDRSTCDTKVARQASVNDLTFFKEVLTKFRVLEMANRVVGQTRPAKHN